MPQIKTEKKFFINRTSKNCGERPLESLRTIAVTKFQELQKNIAGGEG
jgi:hypothetical protein